MEERAGDVMKIQRFVFLVSLCTLSLVGCSGLKGQLITEEQNMDIEIKVADNKCESISESEETETVCSEETIQEDSSEVEESKTAEYSAFASEKKTEPQELIELRMQEQCEPEKQQVTPKPSEAEASQQEPEQLQPENEPQQAQPVHYSPQRVVQLAVKKTKTYDKVYIPDSLNHMLAEGMISQKDYNAYYPTDVAGYIEFYVASDMNEARDVSGTIKFNSKDDIAENIAGMYNALTKQYFYIEYHGTVVYGDRECYVFYCYRA